VNDELRAALDVPFALAMKTIVEACGRLDKAGVAFLIAAAGDENSRVRNQTRSAALGRWGKADIDASMACLLAIEANDSVPDVRTAGEAGEPRGDRADQGGRRRLAAQEHPRLRGPQARRVGARRVRRRGSTSTR